MVKALVTGGLGFIGSHLAERLLDIGYEVRIADLPWRDTSNISHFVDQVEVMKADLKYQEMCDKVCKGVDAVFHFAAQADVKKSLDDHLADLNNNLLPTIYLLDSMQREGIRDMVFASSSAVYGDPTVVPTPEDAGLNPISLYGASKSSAEAFARAHMEFSPIRFWAFRFANPIGERNKKGVVWNFVNFLASDPTTLPILGDGQQRKGFFYISDCIDGILTGYRLSSERFNAFNIASGRALTVDELATIVIEEMGLDNSKVKRVYAGGKRGWIGDIPVSDLSTEKLKALGWRQLVSPEEAIRKVVRWSRNQIEAPLA